MNRIRKILTAILVFITGIVYTLIPSVNTESLMNGTQSGKTFVFLCLIIVLCLVLLLRGLFLKRIYLRISIPDVLLFTWCLFVVINSLRYPPLSSLRFFEFWGLIVLYMIIRQIPGEYFIWLYAALVTGGGIQALYGNLQLWGYYPSHHGLFKMTGSFFNPGPYAGYLAGIFPAALGLYLFKLKFFPSGGILKTNRIAGKCMNVIQYIRKNVNHLLSHFITNANRTAPSAEKQQVISNKKDQGFTNILFLSVIVLMALVLPASRSRAAWVAVSVSSVYLLFIRYKSNIKIFFYRFWNSSVKKAGTIILLIILASCLISGLYFFKQGSADGRILIWKVSRSMIKDKPLFGYGFDRFKAYYMDYQAAFFEQNPDSEEAMVAGDTNYAFNEFIQQTIENGIIGMMLILLVFIVSGFRFQDAGWEQQLPGVAMAGMINILVFALFSYPAQILPIKMSMVLYLATISSIVPQKEIAISGNRKYFICTTRILFPIIIFMLVFAGCRFIKVQTNAWHDWNSAYRLYQFGAYDACLEDYEKAYPLLKTNGDFLTNCGKALSMAGQHRKAVEILKQAADHYPNIVVYTALGDSYKALGETARAEQAYLHAWYMNPSRFYPKYLLAKLYDESGQKEKAVDTARELLNKEIKVESTAIEEIQEEMQKIIEE